VDEQRKPLAVPPLRPFSPEERRRHAAAELRKAMRREMEQRFLAVAGAGTDESPSS
jgi:acyl-CoA hydrolase